MLFGDEAKQIDLSFFVNKIRLSSLNSSSKSQVYTMKFGSQTIPVYCHMGNFGCGDGGWTLAMKIDGTKVGIFQVITLLCSYIITALKEFFLTRNGR